VTAATATSALPPSAARRVAIPRELSLSALRRPDGPLQSLRGTTMGTSWNVTWVGLADAADTVRAAIERTLARVVAQMSPWEPQSDISRFNAGRVGAWIPLPHDFCEVMACALCIAEESDGCCDPALGTLINLWGFGPQPAPPERPSSADINAALGQSGWRNLAFDPSSRRLMRSKPAHLDLCGIAKGYAVDLVARTLRQYGIVDALVEIGGELTGHGVKPDGTPWWVAVDNPAGANLPPIVVALHGLAIATSGCERHFQHAGAIYSHTLDPRTGVPIDNGMVTATVLHDSCMQADAYATALMVMGPERALAFAEEKQLAAVIRYRPASHDAIAEALSTPMQAML
jgi:thiamine biosynthesis lipoprotein